MRSWIAHLKKRAIYDILGLNKRHHFLNGSYHQNHFNTLSLTKGTFVPIYFQNQPVLSDKHFPLFDDVATYYEVRLQWRKSCLTLSLI